MFHDVLLCLTVFYVYRVLQQTPSPDRQPRGRRSRKRRRDRRQLRRNRRWRRRNRRYRRKRDPMLNSVLNGVWSNSVPGRKIPEGYTVVVYLIGTLDKCICRIYNDIINYFCYTKRQHACVRVYAILTVASAVQNLKVIGIHSAFSSQVWKKYSYLHD